MRHAILVRLAAIAPLLSMTARAQELAPWVGNTDPSDVSASHVEDITAGTLQYTVVQGGYQDGFNCRGPLGCGNDKEGVLEQTWESNRAVRMENLGTTDAVNPWLSNGRNDYRSVAEIVARATQGLTTDADKAFALWWDESRIQYHAGGEYNDDLCDVVRVYNCYGHNTCGNDSICLGTLWMAAGMQTGPAHGVGHCIAQVYYDDSWHFLDSDLHAVYLMRDNLTVAGEQDIVRDHDLIKRSHSLGILLDDSVAREERTAAMYVFDGPPTGSRGRTVAATMDMTLRPNEALVWRWGHLTPAKVQGGGTPVYPDTICNGLWEYSPDFSSAAWQSGAEVVQNITGTGELSAVSGQTGTIVWEIASPYVFVGGTLTVDATGVDFDVSFDGSTWTAVTTNFDTLFTAAGPARYSYRLRCTLSGTDTLRSVQTVNDLQMAPLALPEMRVGSNSFTYADASSSRTVRITHEWEERSASQPPAAPPSALSPTDGGESTGTQVVFSWTVPTDPDGDAIDDYHFELSNRADMRWPLSMSFAKLISRTADAGTAQYSPPHTGLLTPDTPYYWRVRAKDAAGVWGPWSATWSFTPRAPGVPLNVAVTFNATTGVGTLGWQANPVGNAPTAYRVYASDEKGFTASDVSYPVDVGASTEVTSPFPANFVAETADTSMVVLGPDSVANARKAYYRVVAVDAPGSRSGASDYAESPRPAISSAPVTVATVGQPYSYQVTATRSIGDLRLDPAMVKGHWDIEYLSYAVATGPSWLAIDPTTGVLSGTPASAGSFPVTVSASLQRTVRTIDQSALAWGTLSYTDEHTETVGPASQSFVVIVGTTAPGDVVPGLLAEYYELTGASSLPDFATLSPHALDAVPGIDYPSTTGPFATSGRADQVGAVFSGYIEAPADGTYTFYLTSSDGSRLSIDGTLVVDNDGVHGMTEVSGTITLTTGLHQIEVEYFDDTDEAGLVLEWSGPGIGRTTVPASAFFVSSTAVPTLAVAAPVGGQYWGVQDLQIRWTGSFVGSVSIEYSDDDWVTSTLAGTAASADGHYVWQLPNVAAASASIRLTDDADGLPSAVSAPFSVDSITDTDGDQLDDAWEVAVFGDTTTTDGTGDADGDGSSDLEEFWARTDPLAAPSGGGTSVSCAAGARPTSMPSCAAVLVLLVLCLTRPIARLRQRLIDAYRR